MTRDLRKQLKEQAKVYLSEAERCRRIKEEHLKNKEVELAREYEKQEEFNLGKANAIWHELNTEDRTSDKLNAITGAVKVGLAAVGIGVAIWEFKVLRKIELNNCLPEKKGMEELMKMSMKNLM